MPPGWPAVLPGLIRRFAETGHTANSNRKMRGADPPLKSETPTVLISNAESDLSPMDSEEPAPESRRASFPREPTSS